MNYQRCPVCDAEITISDCLSVNPDMDKGYIHDLWYDSNVTFLCCTCFRIIPLLNAGEERYSKKILSIIEKRGFVFQRGNPAGYIAKVVKFMEETKW